MPRSIRFWISMAAFQLAFALAVFALTRQYYMETPQPIRTSTVNSDSALPAFPDSITVEDLERFNLSVPNQSNSQNPVDISRQANEYFANKQYDKAAELYEKLLEFDPDNVDTYNNLGITLHYLGRSTEALSRLNEGLTVDPTHQRTWLTIGFVNSQLGDTDQARFALGNAASMGTDEKISETATEMLDDLP